MSTLKGIFEPFPAYVQDQLNLRRKIVSNKNIGINALPKEFYTFASKQCIIRMASGVNIKGGNEDPSPVFNTTYEKENLHGSNLARQWVLESGIRDPNAANVRPSTQEELELAQQQDLENAKNNKEPTIYSFDGSAVWEVPAGKNFNEGMAIDINLWAKIQSGQMGGTVAELREKGRLMPMATLNNITILGGTKDEAGHRGGIGEGTYFGEGEEGKDIPGGAYGDPRLRADKDTDDNYGIVPMPGIVDATIRTKSDDGSLREAQVNFHCHNRRQLEILEMLYMRPGYPIMLEWGWNPYIQSLPGGQAGEIEELYPILEDFFDEESDLTGLNLAIGRRKMEAGGNYDGFIGYVKNFNFKATDIGGFECTTEIIAHGEILESLKSKKVAVPYREESDGIPAEGGEKDYGASDSTTVSVIDRFLYLLKSIKETLDRKEYEDIAAIVGTDLADHSMYDNGVFSGDYWSEFLWWGDGSTGTTGARKYNQEIDKILREMDPTSAQYLVGYQMIVKVVQEVLKVGKEELNVQMKPIGNIDLTGSGGGVPTEVGYDAFLFGTLLQDVSIVKHKNDPEAEEVTNSRGQSAVVTQYEKNIYVRWDLLCQIINFHVAAGYKENHQPLVELTYLGPNQRTFNTDTKIEDGLVEAYYERNYLDYNLPSTDAGTLNPIINDANLIELLGQSFDPGVCIMPHQFPASLIVSKYLPDEYVPVKLQSLPDFGQGHGSLYLAFQESDNKKQATIEMNENLDKIRGSDGKIDFSQLILSSSLNTDSSNSTGNTNNSQVNEILGANNYLNTDRLNLLQNIDVPDGFHNPNSLNNSQYFNEINYGIEPLAKDQIAVQTDFYYARVAQETMVIQQSLEQGAIKEYAQHNKNEHENYMPLSSYTKTKFTNKSIGLIYFNLDYLIEMYENARFDKDEDEKLKLKDEFSMMDWISKIWGGVNEATAGYYNFDLQTEHERPHVVRIIDKTVTGDVPPNIFEFNPQGLNSIVRDYIFNSKIDNDMAATISIAAQAPRDINSLNALSFKSFHKNITNRFTDQGLQEYNTDEAKAMRIELYDDIEKYDGLLYQLQKYQKSGREGHRAAYTNKDGDLVNYSADEAVRVAGELEELLISIKSRYPLMCGSREDFPEIMAQLGIQIPTDEQGNYEEGGEHSKYTCKEGESHPFAGYFNANATQDKNAIIPLRFSLQLDGIAGISPLNIFKINSMKLPIGYQRPDIAFIVSGENQKITSKQDWITEIEGQLTLLNSNQFNEGSNPLPEREDDKNDSKKDESDNLDKEEEDYTDEPAATGTEAELIIKAMDLLIVGGASKMGAAAIAGNMDSESGLIVDRLETKWINKKQSYKGGIGLVQWTGSRRTKFEKHFGIANSVEERKKLIGDSNSKVANYQGKVRNKAPFESQVNYYWEEIGNNLRIKMAQAKNAAEAADAILADLRPASYLCWRDWDTGSRKYCGKGQDTFTKAIKEKDKRRSRNEKSTMKAFNTYNASTNTDTIA